jgi:photosystem II stability/assembly factor-like uncharacterized protein
MVKKLLPSQRFKQHAMKKYLLFIAVIFMALSSSAKLITVEKAKEIAIAFYAHNLSLDKSQPVITESEVTEYKSIVTYYIFNFDPKGFVIVAADDASIPILGYSNESTIQGEITNPATKEWLESYSREIYQIVIHGLSNTETVKRWNAISAGNFYAPEQTVGPLLTTTWDQGCYYNALCPYDGSAGYTCFHVYTGCVATAMSQIMKYHNFPPQGVGSHSYVDPTYGLQSANFGATTYGWSSMPNNITSANTPVATLMYHSGVSVDMKYSTSGSGAFSENVPDALMNYFNYHPGVVIKYKNSFQHLADFENLIRADLDQQLPVYYSGSNPSEGHAFVCDGYKLPDSTFHFNWGWSGSYNGWFAIGALNPGGSPFNDNNAIVIHIKPYDPNLIVRITHPVDNAIIGVGYSVQIVGHTARGASNLMKIFIDSVEKASTTNDSIVYTWNTSAPDLGSHYVQIYSYNATDTVYNAINLNVAQWISQASSFSTTLGINYMSAADSNSVWATAFGSNNQTGPCSDYTRTSDGGNTWTPGTIPNTTGLASSMIFAMSAAKAYDLMYKVSGSKPQGVYITTDTGTTWTRQTTASFSNSSSFPDCIHFFNENEGWVLGDPINGSFEIYTTTDGGNSWTQVSSSNIPAPLSGEFGVVGYYSAVQDTLWFGTNKGRIYHSTDKGHTWSVATVPALSGKYISPSFQTGMHGLAQDRGAGSTGTICETFDGGVTWSLVSETGLIYATDLHFVPGAGNVCVSSGSSGTNGCSYSFNGGHFWNDFVGTQGAQYMQMTWLNNHCGWAGGINSSSTENGIYKFIGVLTIPLPSPLNLQANVDNQLVHLTWQKPIYDSSSVSLQGYNVYRDNQKLNTTLLDSLSYYDPMVPSGQYTYCVTSVYTQGESAKECKEVSIVAVGINSQEQNTQIHVYPNPVVDLLHIRSAGTINDLQLDDLSGKEVFHSQSRGKNIDFQVSDFRSGIYILTLQTNCMIYHIKVVIR